MVAAQQRAAPSTLDPALALAGPAILTPNFDGIPAQLRQTDQWLGWCGRWKPDGRLDKPPCRHDTGETCDAHAPANWATFQQAITGWETHHLAGVGFDLTDLDPFAVIDLDHCVTTEATGDISISPEAATIVRTANSYTERTPSTKYTSTQEGYGNGSIAGHGRWTEPCWV